jgi:hypothetical protein
MTDPNLNILGQLELEWRDLLSGIRQEKLETLFMATAAVLEHISEITPAERAEALALHDQTEKDLIAAIENLSDAQWRFKPSPDRWSVQEITEHLVLTERFFTNILGDVLSKPADPSLQESAEAWEMMRTRVFDRSVRNFPAPPPMVPQGQWSVAQTIQNVRAARAATREFITREGLPLKDRVIAAGPGKFTAFHWISMLSYHIGRHLGQITENKLTPASGGYPA